MKTICEKPELERKLGIAEDGDLCVFRNGEWIKVGFNDRYAGEYPSCLFQDILYARDDFYAAATTADGGAAVYSSCTGENWAPVNLVEKHYWAESTPPQGGAVKMFFEPCMNQILLVCSGGDVVSIPDCPKCVKVMHVADRTVVDASYEDRRMTLTYEDGQKETVALQTADRIRVSMSYAIQACKEGGELIDIRPNDLRRQDGPVPCTAAIDPEDLDDYLQTKDPHARLTFMCTFGTVADQAAWHAYYAGFPNARSVGGYLRGFHVV